MSREDALARVIEEAAARRAKREKAPHWRCDRSAREWEAEQQEEVTQ